MDIDLIYLDIWICGNETSNSSVYVKILSSSIVVMTGAIIPIIAQQRIKVDLTGTGKNTQVYAIRTICQTHDIPTLFICKSNPKWLELVCFKVNIVAVQHSMTCTKDAMTLTTQLVIWGHSGCLTPLGMPETN